MKIEIDTNNLSDLDLQILSLVTTGTSPAPAAAPVVEKPKRQPKAAPVVEVPTSEEDGLTGEDLLAPADPADPPAAELTINDAVVAATPLISGGKGNGVKAVLTDLGVAKVSQLPADKIQAFIDGISKL